MIPRPEFGDYHKFRVSLAVAMIAAGPVIIWFFLRQPFDLLRTASEIDALTPFARMVIEGRQYVSTAATVLAIVGGVMLFVLGIRWLRDSLQDWKDIQDIHDEILLLDRDLKKADLRPMTSEEIVEGDREEIAAAAEASEEIEVEPSPQPREAETLEAARRLRLLKYRELQSKFARKLKEYTGDRYLLLTDHSVRRLRYDFLLRSLLPELPDVLIEFKATSSRMVASSVRNTIYEYAVSASVYADSVGRRARLLIIYVVTDDGLEAFNPEPINERLGDVARLGVSVSVLFSTESALLAFDRDELGLLLSSSDSRVFLKA